MSYRLAQRLRAIASSAFDVGAFSAFKRLERLAVVMAETDTDKQLDSGLSSELSKGDEPHDAPEDGEVADSADDDDDTEAGFEGFPAGALPYKERKRGPHTKDVKPGKPDWWNPW